MGCLRATALGYTSVAGLRAVPALPVPAGQGAERGFQCGACFARDDLRHMHDFHRSGHAPAGMRDYLAQPHWLYIATFADGTTKVGTASERSKWRRLAEQGAVVAQLRGAGPGRGRGAACSKTPCPGTAASRNLCARPPSWPPFCSPGHRCTWSRRTRRWPTSCGNFWQAMRAGGFRERPGAMAAAATFRRGSGVAGGRTAPTRSRWIRAAHGMRLRLHAGTQRPGGAG